MSDAEPKMQVGFSPCPNDTFMFHGLIHGPQGSEGYAAVMADIESLNLRAIAGKGALPVTKLSVAALGRCVDRYRVLDAGAALGRGVGPLVVRRRHDDSIKSLADLVGRKVAVPGENTTARLLLGSFAPQAWEPVVMVFSEVMEAVAGGEADAGVIIHEGRFTYEAAGLAKVADLGEVWESETGLPLPLGVICVERSVSQDDASAVQEALRASINSAFADAGPAWPWIRQHSQEMSEAVCREHIDLYVNDYSVSLGEEGRAAIDEMFRRARANGAMPPGREPW